MSLNCEAMSKKLVHNLKSKIQRILNLDKSILKEKCSSTYSESYRKDSKLVGDSD